MADPAAAPPEPDYPEGRYSDYAVEDWLGFGLFWALATIVFLQFFTRYILNSSLAWTEEMARYLLTVLAFLGGGVAVRKVTHIHVEFLFVYLPLGLARIVSGFVDLVRIAFFAYAAWLCWLIAEIMHGQRMVIFDWPMSWVFGPCAFGLAIMAARSVQVAWRHWFVGRSPLIATREEGRHQ